MPSRRTAWPIGCGIRARKDFALYLQSRSSEVFQTDIHPAARIGKGIFIDHATGLVVGETAVIEDDVSMLHGVTLGGTGKEGGDRHPKVRYGVLIGAGAKILGNIEIGHCSKVAAGSVVLASVPHNTRSPACPRASWAKPVATTRRGKWTSCCGESANPAAASTSEAGPRFPDENGGHGRHFHCGAPRLLSASPLHRRSACQKRCNQRQPETP